MAQIDIYKQKAQAIRNEVTIGANTAERVGEALEMIGNIVDDFAKLLVVDLTLAELQAQTHTPAVKMKVSQILSASSSLVAIKPSNNLTCVSIDGDVFTFYEGSKRYRVEKSNDDFAITSADIALVSSSVTYGSSSSSTDPSSVEEWTSTIPSIGSDSYLWSRTSFTYADGTTSYMYSVGLMTFVDGSVTITKINANAIDNVPTANSNNLVKSGGVKSAIDTVQKVAQNVVLATTEHSSFVKELYMFGSGVDTTKTYMIKVVAKNHSQYKWSVVIYDGSTPVCSTINNPTEPSNPILIPNYQSSNINAYAILNWDEFEDGAYLSNLNIILTDRVFDINYSPIIKNYLRIQDNVASIQEHASQIECSKIIEAVNESEYTRTDNITSTVSNYKVFRFYCPKGQKLYVTFTNIGSNTTINFLATYSDNTTVLLKQNCYVNTTYEITAEKEIKYLGYWCAQTGDVSIKIRGNIVDIEKHNTQLAKLTGVEDTFVNNVVYKNLFIPNNVVVGYEVYGDGTVRHNADSAYIKIPITKALNSNITIGYLPAESAEAYPVRYYSFWDKNNTALETSSFRNSLTEKTLSIPDNATYLLFSVYQREPATPKPDYSGIQVEYGSSKTAYVSGYQYTEQIIIEKSNKHIIIPEVTKKDLNVLIFGDSITETDIITYNTEDLTNPYTISINAGARSNWPKWIKENTNSYVRFANVRNYAKSGASFRDRHLEARQYLGFQIDEMIADLNAPSGGYYYGQSFTPDIVIVSIGANDGNTTSTYETAMAKTVEGTVTIEGQERKYIDVNATLANLDVENSLSESIRHSFMRLRQQFPNAIFFFCSQIHRCQYENIPANLDASSKLAKRYNFIVIDNYSESGIVRDFQSLTGQTGDLFDGLHPNVNGQKKMARNILNHIIANTFITSL